MLLKIFWVSAVPLAGAAETAAAEMQRQHDILQKMFIANCVLAVAFLLACILLWFTWRRICTIKKAIYRMEAPSGGKDIATSEEVLPDNPPEAELQAWTKRVDTTTYQFKRIERLIKEEQLYLNPNLNRQDLLDRLSINKNHFGRILQEKLQMNLSEYLNRLRIQHAIRLMHEHPNYSAQALAEESGFSNLRKFQRNFKEVTGMTFSEFRRKLSGGGYFLENQLVILFYVQDGTLCLYNLSYVNIPNVLTRPVVYLYFFSCFFSFATNQSNEENGKHIQTNLSAHFAVLLFKDHSSANRCQKQPAL